MVSTLNGAQRRASVRPLGAASKRWRADDGYQTPATIQTGPGNGHEPGNTNDTTTQAALNVRMTSQAAGSPPPEASTEVSTERAEAPAVTIELVEARTLDAAVAGQMAEVANAANAADGLDIPPTTSRSLQTLAKYTSGNRPLDALWLVRAGSGTGDGGVVAWACLELPIWDNTHSAYVSCSVDPEQRGCGIGTALLQRQIAVCREADRSLLIAFGPKHSSRIQFLLGQGFEVAQVSAQRRLEPQLLDYGRIEAIAAKAAIAAEDYEVFELDGLTPESMLPAMRILFEAINDAPLDDADLEHDVFTAERVRSYEMAMAARGQHVYRLIARHRPTGDLVGLTILCVDELRPGLAFQEDTNVVRAHRGYRLGLLLKARMLLWMRARHPELTRIDTFNATTNDHMIRVNEELGASVTGESFLLQRHLH